MTADRETSLIEPVYRQTQPNDPIQLGQEAVEYTLKGALRRQSANVRLEFTPADRVKLDVEATSWNGLGLAFVFDSGWDGKVLLPNRQVSFEVLCAGLTSGVATLTPRTSPIAVMPETDRIARAIVHLFNFPDFHSSEDYRIVKRDGDRMVSGQTCGCVNLAADDWRVAIAAMECTGDLCRALSQTGGFVITHVGAIDKANGATFTSAEFSDFLSALYFFLSMALGRWVGVGLPVAFDALGRRVWERWGLPNVHADAWGGSASWFDRMHGDALREVFPGFWRSWKNSTWRTPIEHGVYWYVAANETGTGIGVDTGIMLAQTALELLAWTYCVQHRRMVSDEAFKPRGLSAADKLRLLASSLSIPVGIPASLRALCAKPGRPWDDAPDAITGIRNAIVHPHATTHISGDAGYEAWRLSMWVLDLVFLRLFGHVGEYANRVTHQWVGTTEQVPWANTDSATSIVL